MNLTKLHIRLLVIPSDPLVAYEKAGYLSRLQHRYNPCGIFDEVIIASPLESGEKEIYGMKVVGVSEYDFPRFVKKLHPHVIRAFGGYWASDLACSARPYDIPVVISVHDPSMDMIHESVRHADLVMCTSQTVIQAVCAKGVLREKIHMVPTGLIPTHSGR